jgi:hypothetical protein
MRQQNLLLSVTGPAPARTFWYARALASPRGRSMESGSPGMEGSKLC